MNDNTFTGPKAMFCQSALSEHTALVYASWAGYYAAHIRTEDANRFAELARKAAGKVVAGSIPGAHVVFTGDGEFSLEDCDFLIAVLKITRETCKRRAEHKAEVAKTDSAPAESEVRP